MLSRVSVTNKLSDEPERAMMRGAMLNQSHDLYDFFCLSFSQFAVRVLGPQPQHSFELSYVFWSDNDNSSGSDIAPLTHHTSNGSYLRSTLSMLPAHILLLVRHTYTFQPTVIIPLAHKIATFSTYERTRFRFTSDSPVGKRRGRKTPERYSNVFLIFLSFSTIPPIPPLFSCSETK